MTNYFAIFVFILLCLVGGIAVILFSILINILLGKCKQTKAKSAAYECGIKAFTNARMRFNIRYYLIAIFFIIFDVEMAFFFPWAVAIKHIGLAGMIAMGVFLCLLAIGLVYEWRKGALEWD